MAKVILAEDIDTLKEVEGRLVGFLKQRGARSVQNVDTGVRLNSNGRRPRGVSYQSMYATPVTLQEGLLSEEPSARLNNALKMLGVRAMISDPSLPADQQKDSDAKELLCSDVADANHFHGLSQPDVDPSDPRGPGHSRNRNVVENQTPAGSPLAAGREEHQKLGHFARVFCEKRNRYLLSVQAEMLTGQLRRDFAADVKHEIPALIGR